MSLRFVALAAALALAACGEGQQSSADPNAPQFEAPQPESGPSRRFAPEGDAEAALTGPLIVSIAQEFPDASAGENATPKEIMTLSGASGFALQAELVGAGSPAALVEGQTVRALMELPVEASGTLIYRVVSETKAKGQGLCGAGDTGHVLVWEPEEVGEPVFKLMGLLGGAPGEDGARLCPALTYRRA